MPFKPRQVITDGWRISISVQNQINTNGHCLFNPYRTARATAVPTNCPQRIHPSSSCWPVPVSNNSDKLVVGEVWPTSRITVTHRRVGCIPGVHSGSQWRLTKAGWAPTPGAAWADGNDLSFVFVVFLLCNKPNEKSIHAQTARRH